MSDATIVSLWWLSWGFIVWSIAGADMVWFMVRRKQLGSQPRMTWQQATFDAIAWAAEEQRKGRRR
jgi:hypothetical protein